MTDKTKPDRRIERTRTALRDALLRLIHRDSWEAINVRMICAAADVARSSFYLHFDNKLALLDFMFESGLEEAQKLVAKNADWEKNRLDSKYASLAWLVDHVSSKKNYFHKEHTANDVIFLRFQRAVTELLQGELELRNRAVSQTTLSFTVGGVFAVLRDWTAREQGETEQEICEKLNFLTGLLLENTNSRN